MTRATGTRFEPQRLVVLAVALAALASCDEALISGDAAKEKPPADAQDTEGATELFPDVANGSQRDVEAPDVFDVTEAGLWDGRPSLGGIWVAHPDAKQPERVLIKNAANNKSVTGALFRRERNLPGPALQVSSSAAEQLGMLAGSPARLQVVALRREQVKAPPPVAADPDATAASGAAESAGAEADQAAETAQETTQAPAKRKWWQKKKPENTGAGAAAAGAAAAGAAAAGASAAEDSAAAATQSAPAPSGQSSPLADPTVTPPAEKPAKKKWWQKKKPEEITETPLDPIESAAAAIETAEPIAAEVAAGAAAAAPAASSLTKPYIQIGTFSVEANANSAADRLRKNGMAADVLSAKSGDKNVWRVVVGPAATRADRKALLQDVKDLGFQDAFTASN